MMAATKLMRSAALFVVDPQLVHLQQFNSTASWQLRMCDSQELATPLSIARLSGAKAWAHVHTTILHCAHR